MWITSERSAKSARVFLNFNIALCVTQESATKVLDLEIITAKCSDAHNIQNIFLLSFILPPFAAVFLTSSLLVFFKA